MLMFSLIIIGIIHNLLYCYLFNNLVLKKRFKFNKRIVITNIILGILLAINFYYNKSSLKPFVSHMIFFMAMLLSYHESIIKTIIGLLISSILVFISELLFVLIFVNGIGIPQEILNNDLYAFILSNLLIMLISYLLCHIKRAKILINNVINSMIKDKKTRVTLITFFCLTIAIFVIYNNLAKNISLSYLILLNLFFISVYVFIIGFFVEKSNNNTLTSKYDQLFHYSKAYEKELVKRSKRQHEYQNQLIIIKSMVEDKSDELISYIDGLLNDEINSDDIKWLDKLSNIPLGGLKGLLYFKINQMVENKIKVNVSVSEKLSRKSLWKTYMDIPQDISKIIGVYLDNAMEAASMSKGKEVEIQFYLENKNIVFSIGNTFEGKIDENQIDNEGYTSKGSGRGYGLSLVKDLLKKHKELEQERTIIENYYIQNLIIKQKIK